MSTTNSLREGLRLAGEVGTARIRRDALRIVRGVLQESLGPNGLTTTEIFLLATRKPPLPSAESTTPQKSSVAAQSNSNHPIQSIRYLKKTILPILEGNGVIRVGQITRHSSPLAPKPGDKAKKESSALLSRRIWAWMPVDPRSLPKPKVPQPQKPFIGTAVGIGEDWTHLNIRRRRARAEKVTRDYARMKEALAIHGDKIII